MIRKYGLYLVWVIAMIATSVSLYLTEVQYWEPCRLCWYQEMCMFPLVFIAGMAAWYGFLGIARYLIPQTLIGLFLSIYQLIERIYLTTPLPTPPIEICKPGVLETVSFNCNVNLPILATIAFFLINVLLFILARVSKNGDSHESS